MAKKSSLTSSSFSSSSSYATGPPWLFRGSALYQLHLIKSEIARSFIPKELKLVEAFGYTLGGLFLAHYDDSPAGVFDELVVIAGIVWNPPTSCAYWWAARVLVNSREACVHGRKEIGLPSNVATFSKREAKAAELDKGRGFLNMVGLGLFPKRKKHAEIHITELEGPSEMPICNISLPSIGESWMGPMIRMSLPSFSGKTIHNPHLLQYSCQIECRIRVVDTAKISKTSILETPVYSDNQKVRDCNSDVDVSAEDEACSRSVSVLLSKPILTLEFSSLKMQVEAPKIVKNSSRPNPRTKQVGDLKAC